MLMLQHAVILLTYTLVYRPVNQTFSKKSSCAAETVQLISECTISLLMGLDSRLCEAWGSTWNSVCHTEFSYTQLCYFPGNFYLSCNISWKWTSEIIQGYYCILYYYWNITSLSEVVIIFKFSRTSILSKMYLTVKQFSWRNRSFVFTVIGVLFDWQNGQQNVLYRLSLNYE
jgi:hypothetical protein